MDEPGKAVSLGYSTGITNGPETATRLVQEARIRAQPRLDDDLDDRFKVALSYIVSLQEWRKPPVGSQPWPCKRSPTCPRP